MWRFSCSLEMSLVLHEVMKPWLCNFLCLYPCTMLLGQETKAPTAGSNGFAITRKNENNAFLLWQPWTTSNGIKTQLNISGNHLYFKSSYLSKKKKNYISSLDSMELDLSLLHVQLCHNSLHLIFLVWLKLHDACLCKLLFDIILSHL